MFLFSLLCFTGKGRTFSWGETRPYIRYPELWETVDKQCLTRESPKNNGNPYVQFVHQDFDPNINTQEESPIVFDIKEKVVVNLPNNEVEDFLVENRYTDGRTAHKIQESIKAVNSLNMSYNTFKCDDIKNDFDALPNDQKNYNTFWNKKITRDSLLVRATRNETITTLKVKKVVATLKKRIAERREKNYDFETSFCSLKQIAKWYRQDAFDKWKTHYCEANRDIKQVLTSEKIKEIKYVFPAVIKWKQNQIEELFNSVQRQAQYELYLY